MFLEAYEILTIIIFVVDVFEKKDQDITKH